MPFPRLPSRFIRSVTLSLDPKTLSSRASPPGGRERDLLFGRNSVLPIWERFAFSGAPPLLRGGRPCFVDRGFVRFVFVADYNAARTLGAKPCRMNTCTKMVGGWGHAAMCFFGGSVQPVRTSQTWRYAPYWQVPWIHILARRYEATPME